MDGGSEGCWQQQCLQPPFVVTSSGMGSESGASLSASAAANPAAADAEESATQSCPSSPNRQPHAIPLFATTKSATMSISTLNRRMRDSNVGLIPTTFRQRSTGRLDSITARAGIWPRGARPGPVASLRMGTGWLKHGRGRARRSQRSHE